MNDNSQSLWQSELNSLAAQSRHWWVRRWPPRLIVRRTNTMPWWFPPLLRFESRPGAWTFWNLIFVSEELLDCPAEMRHYLSHHEFGHIERVHFLQLMMALTIAAFCVSCSLLAPHFSWLSVLRASHTLPIVLATCFFASFLRAFTLISILSEYQADAFAAQRIGSEAVQRGIRWLAQTSGRGLTTERRKRLNRLRSRATKLRTGSFCDTASFRTPLRFDPKP